MGCWSETCFVTNLPISHGEKIIAFPISKGGYRSSKMTFVYATDEMAPNGLPVIGEYDDYGGIENISKYTSEAVIEWNKKLLRRRGEEEITNLEDYFNDKVRRNEVENQSLIYMLYSVYEKMMEHIKAEEGRFRSSDAKTYGEHLEEEMKQIQAAQKQLTLLEMSEPRPYSDIYKVRNSIESTEIFYFFIREANVPMEQFNDLFEDEETTDSLQSLYLMNTMLSFARKRWVIPSGTGSQAENYDMSLQLARVTIQHVKERFEYRVKDEGWDDVTNWDTEEDRQSIREEVAHLQKRFGLTDDELI